MIDRGCVCGNGNGNPSRVTFKCVKQRYVDGWIPTTRVTHRCTANVTTSVMTNVVAANDSDDEGSVDPADRLFERSQWLQQLWAADEAERGAATHVSHHAAPTILNYHTQYLMRQPHVHYDDLKHADVPYIDYGPCLSTKCPLVIEQDKTLGKGGLCWDAAFILGEFLLARLEEAHTPLTTTTTTTMLELGCGTGICGLYIAKAWLQQHPPATLQMILTDQAGPMQSLIQRNLQRNMFRHDWDAVVDTYVTQEYPHWDPRMEPEVPPHTVAASVLDWDATDLPYGTYDILFGSDVVASLYDPLSLARTIQRLCHERSIVYISGKERLRCMHEQFHAQMQQFFGTVDIRSPSDVGSRNHNPDVFLLVAYSKRPV
jgi:Lysine methyltransferase